MIDVAVAAGSVGDDIDRVGCATGTLCIGRSECSADEGHSIHRNTETIIINIHELSTLYHAHTRCMATKSNSTRSTVSTGSNRLAGIMLSIFTARRYA